MEEFCYLKKKINSNQRNEYKKSIYGETLPRRAEKRGRYGCWEEIDGVFRSISSDSDVPLAFFLFSFAFLSL